MVKRLSTMRETWVRSLGQDQRKWQPTPVLWPRKSHGWRSLVQATAHGVAKSRTRLSDFTSFHFKHTLNVTVFRPNQTPHQFISFLSVFDSIGEVFHTLFFCWVFSKLALYAFHSLIFTCCLYIFWVSNLIITHQQEILAQYAEISLMSCLMMDLNYIKGFC